MKKLITFLAVSSILAAITFAAPTEGVDVALPSTTPVTLDDFEEGMFFNAVKDSWDSFGNVFGKTQFSDNQDTKKDGTEKVTAELSIGWNFRETKIKAVSMNVQI